VRGVRRRGQVFADRYHAVTLTSPRQVHHALAYVLNNWRRHREDVGVFQTRHDVYSTGLQSNAWVDAPQLISLKDRELLPVSFPGTCRTSGSSSRTGRSTRATRCPARWCCSSRGRGGARPAST